MGSHRILIVQEDPVEREHMLATLQGAGYDTVVAATRADVEPENLGDVDALVVDEASFADQDVTEYLSSLAAADVITPCLVVPMVATVERAVELMRNGAFTILTVPAEREQLVLQVEQALRHLEL